MLAHTRKQKFADAFRTRRLRFAAILLLAGAVLINSSCGSKPADPQALTPADPFVFLETSDLGAAMRALTEGPGFKNLARTSPDLSPLDGVRVAISVTGFETRESPVGEEGSELRIQPHFVAIAETNAWNYQAIAFTEEKIGNFVNDIYGGEVALEMFPRHGGQYFVWTAQDGRKAFGLVIGSVVYFANDESSLEKCVAVRNGDAPALAGENTVPGDGSIASGFISKDGISQLAGILGIRAAQKAGDEAEIQSAVAGIVPQLVGNTVTRIDWNARRTENGIEDNISLDLKPDIAAVLRDTMAPADTANSAAARAAASELPTHSLSVTRYAFKDPRIAWRSLLLTARQQLDAHSGSILLQFSSLLFDPYGVRDPEGFLAAVPQAIFTVRPVDEDNLVVLAPPSDREKIFAALTEKLNPPAQNGAGVPTWLSSDGDLAFTESANAFALGSKDAIAACRFGSEHQPDGLASPVLEALLTSAAPIVTIADESPTRDKMVAYFSEPAGDPKAAPPAYSVTETSFDRAGIKRKVRSEFGMLGYILEQFFSERE